MPNPDKNSYFAALRFIEYATVQLHSNSFIFPAANDDFFHYHFLQLVQTEHLNIEHLTIKSTVPPFLFSQPKFSISIKLLIGQSKNLLIPTKMTIASYFHCSAVLDTELK